MNSSKRFCITAAAAVALLAGLAATARAVGTKVWRVTSYKDFEEGETDGVLLSSLGEALTGHAATRVDVPVAQVFSSVTAPGGTVWLGTGDSADLYAWGTPPGKGGKPEAKKICRLDGVLVSALAAAPDGTVYAGTLPGGKLWEVKPAAANPCRELAKLEGADQVWSLVVDAAKKRLYAATGPSGKLFQVELGSGKNKVLWDSGEKHLLSLARAADGALLAGSADEAILFRVGEDGTARALHDFAGDEVRAIAPSGDSVYVAVNEFEHNKGGAAATAAATARPHGTKIVLPTTTIPAAGALPPGRDRKGKGAVFRVEPDGRVEQLHALGDGYFTALHVDAGGSLYAAAGANGRVYLIQPDRTLLTAFNFPERQILTLALDGPHPAIGTGDAGALYAVDFGAPPAGKGAHYFSKVLDAGAAARWGTLRFASSGPVTVETRSGNTSRPDRSWSDWQGPAGAKKGGGAGHEVAGGKVGSPAGRYLQFRAAMGAAAHLRDVSVWYLPQNQRARVTEVSVGEDPASQVARGVKAAGKPRSPIVKVRWKVENPDDDELVFRVYYREEGEADWRAINGGDVNAGQSAAPITARELDWNTETIPDGSYLVKVVASDERANPKEEALEHELISTPCLVDNRRPEVVSLAVAGNVLSGTARDSYSPITELALSVDGGEFQSFAPRDRVLDDLTEEFTVRLPDGLAGGGHSVTVRAVDAADNLGLGQLSFRVNKK